MKKLLVLVAVLMFLPKAHACSASITPSTFTLQVNQQQAFTLAGTSCSGTVTWSLSCLQGGCSQGNGSLPTQSSAGATYKAPSEASKSSTTQEEIQLTATYSGGGQATAKIYIVEVQLNSLLNYVSGDSSAFKTYVIGSPYVAGVNVIVDWSSIQGSNGSSPGTYSFTTLESSITALFPSGIPTKKVNLIFQGVTGGCAIGNPGTCDNTSTPSYVFTTGWANTVNSTVNPLTGHDYSTPVPLDVWAGCGYGDTGGYPAVLEPAFYVAYQAFMNQVISRYSSISQSTLTPYIGYIRFGLSAGGEVYPFCEAQGDYTQSAWLSYVQLMDNYESGLTHTMQLMTSINQTNFPSNYTYPDDEASYAKADGIGFGSQGLQQKDIDSTVPCPSGSSTSDWCYLFDTYAGDVPLELQTTLLSDPIYNGGAITSGSPSETGSLSQIIPYAIANHALIFELYAYDMLYAFDNGSSSPNYCNLSGATSSYCSSGKLIYPLCYQTLLQNVANHATLSQVPPYQDDYCTD